MTQENNEENTHIHIVLVKGTMVHQYRIIEKIGAGGMGEVYLAEDTKLKRQVALKFLPTYMMTNEEVRKRFIREAQTVAKLNHPHIVSIYDVSEFNERPFYVMELVDGESLHNFCHDKTLSIDQIIEYAVQICQGLGEAHRAGIIHRDIKSANIAVDKNERVKLLDFGLAASQDDDKITKTGSTLGTVSYMSPEQISGKDIDHKSDLFSLGVVLYELIAGRTPFKRDNEGATLKAIMEDTPEPLSRFKADVPEKLQEVILKLLEKDKELRYQSAEGVIADLKRMLYDSAQSGIREKTNKVNQDKPRKKGLLIGVVSALALVLILYFVFQFANQSGQQADNDDPMIVVLPFENLGSSDDQYFAEGMTEEITSRLAMIDGLGVISRTSAIKYRETDKSLKEIGAELGVDYVLEGTVRWSKVGDTYKIRITPQLIRVSDDRHMWAGNFEESLVDVFAIQEQIAIKIVEQLGMTLVEKDKLTLASKPTENAKAYQLYLQALSAYNDNAVWSDSATHKIDSAILLDSSFALAYALKSEIYSNKAFGFPDSDEGKISLESALKSLELSPGLAAGHIALGKYYNQVETDYQRALDEFSLAKSEVHNNSELLEAIGFVQMRQGNFEEAIMNQQKAAELDPLNSSKHFQLAMTLYFVKRYQESHQAIDRAISLEPDKVYPYRFKAETAISNFGDIEKVKPIIIEALKSCDSLKLFSQFWDYKEYLPEFDWDLMIVKNIEQLEENRKSSNNDTSYYYSMFNMYQKLNDTLKAQIYLDSLHQITQKLFNDLLAAKFEDLKNHPRARNFSNFFGIVLSETGYCEEGIQFNKKIRELSSIEECHF